MKRLAPGVYDDGHGGLHLDLTELLAAHGFPDTPANREALIKAVNETSPAPVTVTDDPVRQSYTCPRCHRVSYNPHDLEHRYCGACHQFENP